MVGAGASAGTPTPTAAAGAIRSSSVLATSALTAAAGSRGWKRARAAAKALSEGIDKPAFCPAARSTIDSRPTGIVDAASM